MDLTTRLFLLLLALVSMPALGQETVTVRPQEIDDVLINPGIGFMTFQRFNGDRLNEAKKWTEGYPIEYQDFDGNLENENHPLTSLAYFRVYWRFIEPLQDEYRWDLIDKALETAGTRGQTLLLRIAPYGTGADNDVPDWYREMVGQEDLPVRKWRTDPEDPRYIQHFGDMVRDLGARYDGHPLLESVDLSIVGAWGEGEGSERLTQKTREALVDSYLEAFRQTYLVMLLTDAKTNRYGLSKRDVGWRVDCLGDMGGFSSTWCHMLDYYPQAIINFGMKDAWKKAPVTLEVCWVMQHWLDEGWDVDYIIDQSLKWHISSFNAKSSPVPEVWEPHVERWLKRMGYRFVLRKFTYPDSVKPGDKLAFTSWWENKGVAPCYRPFRLALRLKGPESSTILVTDADLRAWLPGDNLYDSTVTISTDTVPGEFDLEIAILDERFDEPHVKLAIAGRRQDGWYELGKINVQH
ncbi:MAG: DUF4832 domain-containing protein [Phycisphaerales bacterium]|nr:MAG: DUF4832 domain-containing protein [Phycisphaerales bacterium]